MADVSLFATGVVVCTLSALFALVAIRKQRAHQRWCARGIKAEGIVSRIGKRRGQGLSENAMGNSTGPVFHSVAVVRFRAANGQEYEIDAEDAPLTVGTAVQVAYDPAEPSGARAVERVAKIGCSIILLPIGLFLVAVGAGWLFR